jgi:hypothetical protein
VNHGGAIGKLRVTGKQAYVYTNVEGDLKKLKEDGHGKDIYVGPDDGWKLLELSGSAPSGYVWVAPGDSNTAMGLGALTGMQLRRKVKIPKPSYTLDQMDPDYQPTGNHELPAKRYMNPEELSAWNASQSGTPGYYFHEKDESGYRGSVYIYEYGPMVGGMVLMKRSDVGPDS